MRSEVISTWVWVLGAGDGREKEETYGGIARLYAREPKIPS